MVNRDRFCIEVNDCSRMEAIGFLPFAGGVDQGPYTNETEARLALRVFIEEQLQFEEKIAAEW